MRILALDLGTFAGWACSGTPMLSGVLDLRPRRFDGGGMRYVQFRRAFQQLLPADLVVFEEVRRHLGVDAAHVYGGLMGVLTAECDGREPKIPYRGVPVGTIKRHATGKGNADKGTMLQSAREKWPRHFIKDDNEADALWLLDYAVKEFGDWVSVVG